MEKIELCKDCQHRIPLESKIAIWAPIGGFCQPACLVDFIQRMSRKLEEHVRRAGGTQDQVATALQKEFDSAYKLLEEHNTFSKSQPAEKKRREGDG